MNTPGMNKFDDALNALLMMQPFYGQLALKMDIVETTDLPFPTMAVTPWAIQFHPDFMEKSTLDEIIFGCAHEIAHLAWDHLDRLKYYLDNEIGPDGKPLDAMLFNMAMDYPINDSLVKAKIGKPIDGCCLDTKYPDTMTPEEIYCQLKKDGKGKGKGNSFDNHISGRPGDPGEAGQSQGKAHRLTTADIIQAAELHKAVRGEYPQGMERLIGALRKPTGSPWAMLRQFVVTALRGQDHTSWRRLNRTMIVRRIGVPGRLASGTGKIGIVVDTSGSIDQTMLELFGGHMAAIMGEAKPQRVNVYWTDAAVQRVDTIKTPAELVALLKKPVPGGGGTDMPKGVANAELDKCDIIAVLTDGMTPFCSSKRPLIWAITTPSIKADGNGKTISIR